MSVYEQLTLPSIDTAAELRAQQAYPVQAPIIYLGGIASVDDGYQGWFQWVPGDTTADDDLNYIKSNWADIGRWIRVPYLASWITGIVPVANGGTGVNDITAHSLVVGTGTTPVVLIAPDATIGIPLVSAGSAADPGYGTAVVAGGGTGLTTVAQGDLLYSSAIDTLSALAKSGTAHQFLSNTGTANNPAWAQPAISDLQDVAADVLLGNNTGAAGPVLGLTVADVLALLGLRSLTAVATQTANYTVPAGVGFVPCDTTGGAFYVVVPLAFGTATNPYPVQLRLVAGTNAVNIRSVAGTATDYNLLTVNDAGGAGVLTVWVDGTNMWVDGQP